MLSYIKKSLYISSNQNPLLMAIFALLGVGFFLFILFWWLVIVIARWKVYEKAGQPGWASIIPFYDIYILLKIIGKPGWWILLVFIPGVNIIIVIWMINLLSKSFGKDVGFTLGLIFFGWLFYPILGFGSAEYVGPVGDPEAYARYQQSKNPFDFEQRSSL